MKPTSHRALDAVFIGLSLSTGVHASYQPALPPDAITTWTPYADTGFAAPVKHSGSVPVTSFTGFTAPLIFGDLALGGSTQLAFKGYMARTGTVGTSNDEAIWSNVDPIAGGGGSTIWMVAQEGDTVGGRQLGNSGQMKIRSLQTTTYEGTLFTTNTNVNAAPNFSVYEGGALTALAGAGLPGFTNGGIAVAAAGRLAVWTTGGGADGIRAWDVTLAGALPHNVTPAPPGAVHWTSPTGNPRVQCSPAISFYGGIALRARSSAASGFPPPQRDHILAVPMTPAGFFPTTYTVVRGGDPAPTGEIFGTFHPVLMAIAGGPNIPPTVAWQMNTMNAGEGSTAGSGIPYGSPIPVSNSLWCWRQGSIAQIARAGQAAPEITGRTFKSFYALHLVDDDNSWPDSLAFYGAILDNGKYAIYMRQVVTVGPTTTLSPDQLIATDSPGAPAAMDVPAIYGPSGTAYPLAALYPWFAVDMFGNVLMKATLSGAPASQKQCLISSKRGTDGHGLRMRAQSGGTVVLPTLTHGPKPISNFTINAHEQGTMGRGQSIFEQTVSALVSFPGGSGIYTGF
jgi:hypothetical protein